MNKRKACTMLVSMLVALALGAIPAGAAQAPVELTGQTTFVGVFTDSGFVFSPADWNFCDATAIIVQEEGDVLTLEVAECGNLRTCAWEFTVGGDGVATGGMMTCDPDFETGSLVSDIQSHTGCAVTKGTFPVYEGTWDGSTLSVSGDLLGPCDGGMYWGDASFWDDSEWGPGVDDPEGYLDDGVTAEDGPARVTFGLDLSVSAAAEADSSSETLPTTGGGAVPVQAVLMGLGGLAVAVGLGTEWLRRRWR